MVVGVGVVDLGEVTEDCLVHGECGGGAGVVGEGSDEVAGFVGAVHDADLGLDVFECFGAAGVAAGGVDGFLVQSCVKEGGDGVEAGEVHAGKLAASSRARQIDSYLHPNGLLILGIKIGILDCPGL